MDKRRFRRVCRIMFAVSVLLNVASWIALAFSLICIVNGNNWKTLPFLALSIAGIIVSSQMADAAEARLDTH